VIRSGVQWRFLPQDMPPWQTVYNHFYRLKNRGIWDQILRAYPETRNLEKIRQVAANFMNDR
jgi:transposase